MTISEMLLPEFDHEMKTTRRVLERVPDDRGPWKPHPRSFSMGHLAQLVSRMPGWLTTIIRETELDISKGGGYSYEPTAALLEQFDANVRQAREAIASLREADLTVPWSLKLGEKVLSTDPRGTVIRETINHLVHHRAQLGVYLRLCDIPVPSMYGPSADEPWSA